MAKRTNLSNGALTGLASEIDVLSMRIMDAVNDIRSMRCDDISEGKSKARASAILARAAADLSAAILSKMEIMEREAEISALNAQGGGKS